MMPSDSEIIDTMRDAFDLRHDQDATLRKYAAIARALESEEWKLAPFKPTDKQWDEGWHVFHTKAGMDGEEIAEAIEEAFGDESAMDGLVGEVYVAMLESAPQFQEE
jgi:hypothetical protein